MHLGNRSRAGSASYLAYFANPFTVARSISLAVAEIIRERWQAWRQRRNNILPRVKRSFTYAFVRAGTNVLMQEACTFMVTADVLRGAAWSTTPILPMMRLPIILESIAPIA